MKKTIRKKKVVEKSAGWDQLWLQSLESKLVGESITEPYKQHQTVYMILDALASCMPTVEFKIYKGDNEVKEGPIIDLFTRPNSQTCRFQLWEATIVFYAYYGEAFWTFTDSIGSLTKSGGLPAEIWVRNPTEFKTLASKDNVFYGFRSDKLKRNFTSEELVHFRKFNMFDDIRGFAPTTPIRGLIDMDYKSQLYNKSFFDNSAELNGYISTANELSDKAYERLLKQFEMRHRGPQNAHKIGILENDLKYTSSTETHKDMEFLEQRRYTREELLGIWRVPKFMFSVTDQINRATAIASKRIFWENSIIPLLKYIEERLNSSFFINQAKGYQGYFDLSNIPELQEDFTSKVDNAVKLASIGVPLQQINERLDLGFDVLEEPILPEPLPEPVKAPKEEKAKRLLLLSTMDRVTGAIQKSIFSKMKKYLFELRKEILEGLNKDFKAKEKGLDSIARLDWQKLNEKLKAKLKPDLLNGIFMGSKTAQIVMRNKLDEILYKPKMMSLLQTKLNNLEQINRTLKRNLVKVLNEGLSDGLGVAEMSDKVRDFFNISESSARMIAQTETIGAYNGGSHLYYKESGVKRKRWLCTRDDKTRDTHRWDTADGVDGEIVDMDKNFSNGVDYPGGNGPAEEVINCRCTIIPELEG